MPGNDRQPSSAFSVSSLTQRTSGLMKATGSSPSLRPASLASTRNIRTGSPIWTAAMPRPFSAYIESRRSAYRRRTSSVIAVTARVSSRSRGSGQTTTGRTAMATTYARHPGVSMKEKQPLEGRGGRVAYSAKHLVPMQPVERYAEADLPTRFGTFRIYVYRNLDKDHVAMVCGDVRGSEDVLARVHSECFTGEVLGS